MSERDVRAVDVTRALTRALSEAALVLKSGKVSDEQIHTVRKTLKSARAKLRVLRDAVGSDAYARENAALRDAARPLGDVRDSKAMLDTVNDLIARKGPRARRPVLTALRARLQQAHRAARARFEAGRIGATTASRLQRVAERVAQSKPRRRRGALVHGIERVYRKARKALARVVREPSPENLHELRKQVKYLRQALAPLPSRTLVSKKRVDRADKLGSVLGEDHDLHVLDAAIAAWAPPAADVVTEEIAKRRAKLQKRALRRARKLLGEKPRAFAKRLAV